MTAECGQIGRVLSELARGTLEPPACAPSGLACLPPGPWCEGTAYGYTPCFQTMTILVLGAPLTGRCPFWHLPLPCLLPAKVTP